MLILDPYNNSILADPQVQKWGIYSSSLTWMGTVTKDKVTGEINNILRDTPVKS